MNDAVVVDDRSSTMHRPSYVEQNIRLLRDTDRPERYLRPEYFRTGPSNLHSHDSETPWIAINRDAFVRNEVNEQDLVRGAFSRVVVTADAGLGKSTFLRRLQLEINRSGSDDVALLVGCDVLPEGNGDQLLDHLAQRFRIELGVPPNSFSVTQARQVILRLRQQGRLVLLLDGLDQLNPGRAAVAILHDLLNSPEWRSVRVFLSGRLHAIQRHWSELFDVRLGHGWRFATLDEFTEDQRKLGQASIVLIGASPIFSVRHRNSARRC